MKVWFYNLETWLFTGKSFSGDIEAIALNTPQGFGAMVEVTDWQSQRIDPSTGAIVDYQPPAPGDDHEWDGAVKRWRMKPEAVEAHNRKALALARIAELEAKQPRLQRELRKNPDDPEANARWDAIDAEIASLRTQLTP